MDNLFGNEKDKKSYDMFVTLSGFIYAYYAKGTISKEDLKCVIVTILLATGIDFTKNDIKFIEIMRDHGFKTDITKKFDEMLKNIKPEDLI